jgi:hypothetical protein
MTKTLYVRIQKKSDKGVFRAVKFISNELSYQFKKQSSGNQTSHLSHVTFGVISFVTLHQYGLLQIAERD